MSETNEMKTGTIRNNDNPLGTENVTRLMIKFAVPSIIAMVIGAVYNIVDQLFIGNAVGTLGNAATNVVFPLTTVCVALGLMFGIGGAACFNLDMGRGKPEKAIYYIGHALTMLVITGVLLCVVSEIFMHPLLRAFGTPDDVMPYAVDYLRITAIGFPFLILTTGGGHLMRADGSPRMTMITSLTGAIINTILDALFVMVFGWGMQGAALATIIGQIISAIMVVIYMGKFKSAPLKKEYFRLTGVYIKQLMALGASPFFNQITMMVVQIAMNNTLTYYGALSAYGSAIPLACCGIIMKVFQIFFTVIIGISQGAQPIESFNYGAMQYGRVRETYLKALAVSFVICLAAFIVFRVFPRQILELFGSNTEEYFEFGVKFFRTFMFFTWLNFLQPLSANLFTAIGKPRKGIFLSLTRQLIFILPLIIILPRIFGLMGVLYSAPVSDLLSAIVAVILATKELRIMKAEETEKRMA